MKIQLKDVARTWWKSMEARLETSIAWKAFLGGFYVRFLPQVALNDRERRLME